MNNHIFLEKLNWFKQNEKPESVLEQKMRPLVGNRILYPDGTINSFVQRYLREQVVKLFKEKR